MKYIKFYTKAGGTFLQKVKGTGKICRLKTFFTTICSFKPKKIFFDLSTEVH